MFNLLYFLIGGILSVIFFIIMLYKYIKPHSYIKDSFDSFLIGPCLNDFGVFVINDNNHFNKSLWLYILFITSLGILILLTYPVLIPFILLLILK